jgi:uncharacterized Zn-binding protein involved in type VI secretion
MSKVFANGRSILHKGSGNTHTSAAPDVCKVPTPFVNSAQDSMLTQGSKRVTINGHPVALTDSELNISSGGKVEEPDGKGQGAWKTPSAAGCGSHPEQPKEIMGLLGREGGWGGGRVGDELRTTAWLTARRGGGASYR